MTTDPLVRVIFHVMLTMPQALGGSHGPWYCTAGAAHADVPTPSAIVRSYERELRRYGPVTDRFGFGTWTVGNGSAAGIAFEEGDHLEVVMHLATARRVVPELLHRMRVQLAQRETLAEMVGGYYGPSSEDRVRFVVTLPFGATSFATFERIHTIFGDGGNGGATQTDGPGGVAIASGVLPADAHRIGTELRAAGFAAVTGRETFVTDDAPPCSTR